MGGEGATIRHFHIGKEAFVSLDQRAFFKRRGKFHLNRPGFDCEIILLMLFVFPLL